MIIGILVIAIGIIWLFSANGLLDSHLWDVIWALVVIALGIGLIGRSQREKPWWHVFDSQSREEWEKWGKDFGQRMGQLGKSIGQETGEHSKRIGQDLGRQIEDSLNRIFNRPIDESSPKTKSDQSDNYQSPYAKK